MKIYFYHQIIGVYSTDKKVFSQCINLKKAGLDVNVFLVAFQEIRDLNLGENVDVKKDFVFVPPIGLNESNILLKIGYKLRRQWELRKIFVKLIESISSSDVIYLRHPCPLFYVLFPFPKHKKCKIVVEHNTLESKEFKLVGSKIAFIVDLLVGGLMRRKADGIVGVTDEITSYEVRRSGNLRKPHITIGNGFDVSSAPLRCIISYPEDDVHLLCVAHVNRWHGLDRLLQGLAIYSGTPRVVLHIAGNGAELSRLRELADDLGISDRVIYHGFLTGESLDAVFDQCHVAVGSLGIHRIGLTEASILKAREYCARGIPFIIAVSDPDFPPDFPYILRLPADEGPIDIEQVVTFAKEICADPDHPQKMRSYAEDHLDWSVKMKKLKEFLEELVGGNTGDKRE